MTRLQGLLTAAQLIAMPAFVRWCAHALDAATDAKHKHRRQEHHQCTNAEPAEELVA
jgi:hypothetical protein